MTIAPSEKHLEDWIVNNLPRFGGVFPRDWFPDDVLQGMTYFDEKSVISPNLSRIVAQQFRMPYGIADLIGTTGFSLVAVEIKKGQIDAFTVAQCLRYMHDLREIFNQVFYRLVDDPQYQYEIIKPPTRENGRGSINEEVSGIVVGYEMPDTNLQTVCDASNIEILTYEYLNEEYIFEVQQSSAYEVRDQYSDLSYGPLGEAAKSIMQEWADHYKTWKEGK